MLQANLRLLDDIGDELVLDGTGDTADTSV